MPEPRDDEEEKDFISRCIPIVLEDGTAEDEKQAAAVCYSMWRKHQEGKSLTLKEILTALKVGARHSHRDQRALQDIHDAAITLGASCPPPQPEVTTYRSTICW